MDGAKSGSFLNKGGYTVTTGADRPFATSCYSTYDCSVPKSAIVADQLLGTLWSGGAYQERSAHSADVSSLTHAGFTNPSPLTLSVGQVDTWRTGASLGDRQTGDNWRTKLAEEFSTDNIGQGPLGQGILPDMPRIGELSAPLIEKKVGLKSLSRAHKAAKQIACEQTDSDAAGTYSSLEEQRKWRRRKLNRESARRAREKQQSEVSALLAEIESVENDCGAMKVQLNGLEVEKAALARSLATLRRSQSAATLQNEELWQEMQCLRFAYEQRLQALDEALGWQETELQGLGRADSTMQSHVDSVHPISTQGASCTANAQVETPAGVQGGLRSSPSQTFMDNLFRKEATDGEERPAIQK